MARYLCFNAIGECVQEGVCRDGDEDLQRPDLVTVITDAPADSSYLKDGELRRTPPSPGEFFAFDIMDEAWVFDIGAAANSAREQRNRMLSDCDWTQTRDIPEATSAKWRAYRQALRNVPQLPGFPASFDWPEVPA